MKVKQKPDDNDTVKFKRKAVMTMHSQEDLNENSHRARVMSMSPSKEQQEAHLKNIQMKQFQVTNNFNKNHQRRNS